jgi:hypothetical protein
MGVELGFSHLRKEIRRTSGEQENRMLRRTLGPEREKVIGLCTK